MNIVISLIIVPLGMLNFLAKMSAVVCIGLPLGIILKILRQPDDVVDSVMESVAYPFDFIDHYLSEINKYFEK